MNIQATSRKPLSEAHLEIM